MGVQDRVHHVGTHDGRDHLHLSAAVGALLGVDTERPLQQLHADWALVGGFAVSARTVPRFTRDIDLVVSVPGDGDAEHVVFSLSNAGYRVQTVIEQDDTSRLATARLLPPGESPEGVLVDLLFASSGIEPEIAASADRVEVLSGVEIPVATPAHLLAMKTSGVNSRPKYV